MNIVSTYVANTILTNAKKPRQKILIIKKVSHQMDYILFVILLVIIVLFIMTFICRYYTSRSKQKHVDTLTI